MIAGTLPTAAAWAGGSLHGAAQHARFCGLSTDTRRLERDNLFVALTGPRFDGHGFVGEAEARGAAGAVVECACDAALPQIEVGDSGRALGALGASWRACFDIPVIAVTGSNGKTTVKECLASILARNGPALATAGNLNNTVGLPLMLARLDRAHRAAVFELASNQPGEIGTLARWSAPTVGLVTNSEAAHLAGFATVEGVARANAELFAGLSRDGVVVLNADDPWAETLHGLTGGRRVLWFGAEAAAQVRVPLEPADPILELAGERRPFRFRLPGAHNRRNAAAAAAAAWAVGLELDAIVAGLEAVRPVAGRLVERPGVRSSWVLDDSYNANPGSFDAALAVLGQRRGQRWVVVGEMAEMGAEAAAAHRELGRRARAAGVERLWALGPNAAATCAGFGTGASAVDDRTELATHLAQSLTADVTLLVKGSRSNRLEEVVAAVVAGDNDGGGVPCYSH